jgi:hypothetical protein
MLRSLEKSFVKQLKTWANDFSNTVVANNFKNFAFIVGVNESQNFSRKTKTLLQRQLIFVQYCATCKMLGSSTKANLAAIKQWLSMQQISHVSRNSPPPYIVSFYLSDETRLFLAADNLKDIDFADIYSATFFEYISISNRKWKYLTKATLYSTLKLVHDDMAFDQYKIVFGIPDAYAPGRNIAVIWALCQVEGTPTIDKIAKIRKTNELFGTDVLKCLCQKRTALQ